MDIIISNFNNEPIYLQIEKQIKDQIIKGILKEGEALPSMRTLAKDLRISMITTKRAYEDLERDGFIESYPGKGSFVKTQNVEFLKETVLREVEELFTQAVKKGQSVDLTTKELQEILELVCDEMHR